MLVLMMARSPSARLPLSPERKATDDALLDLVSRSLAGDAEASRALIRALTPHLLRTVRRALGRDHPDVEDVTQDAVVNVFQALPRYQQRSTVLHFACRVGLQTAMNVRRRQAYRAHRSKELEQIGAAEQANAPTPEQGVVARDCAEAVRGMLSSLPDPQAEVIGLHYMVGLSVGEVANVMECPLETVRSRLRLGRQTLRKLAVADPTWSEMVGGQSG